MRKTDWRFVIDALLFICIFGLAVIGFLLAFFIPKGPAASESAKYFLGLHRHQWGDIHLYFGLAFIALAVLHLVLGWDWIRGKSRRLFGERWKTALISTPLFALAALVASWLYLPQHIPTYEGHGLGSEGGIGSSAPKNEHGYLRAEGEVLLGSQTSRARSHEEHREVLITGQMSLDDLERQTGIQARVIAANLGIGRGALINEPLGKLKRKYSFTIQDVREVVSALMERR